MAGSEQVRYMLQASATSTKELAKMLGINEQSMYNKLYRNSFSFKEILEIANLLGFEIQIVNQEQK